MRLQTEITGINHSQHMSEKHSTTLYSNITSLYHCITGAKFCASWTAECSTAECSIINFGRVGEKSFKELQQKIEGWKGG